MIKSKIEVIRKKLDKLDTKLLHIIKKRTILVNDVIKLKKKRRRLLIKKELTLFLERLKLNL